MRHRCNNPNNEHYHDYGGRGIHVCDRWNDFANFFSDMGLPPEGYMIDRVDPDGNYEPSNCRWVDKTTSARNKRVTKYATFHGVKKTVMEWCEERGLSAQRVRVRMANGLSAEEAILAGKKLDRRSLTDENEACALVAEAMGASAVAAAIRARFAR